MIDTVISGEFVTEVAFENLAFDGIKVNNAEPDRNAAGLHLSAWARSLGRRGQV